MSLYSDLVEVLTPYANKIKGLVANLGNLSNLETTDKSSIVAAINEAARSGGTEIIIDNTLTQSGQVADAKAAGDAINQLSADLGDLEEYMTASETPDSSEFEIGAISSSTGGNVSLSTRIRTRTFLTKRIFGINVLSGYKYAIYAYEDNASNTYKGSWNGSTFASVTTWLTAHTDVLQLGDCKIRVAIAKSDDSSIDVSDSNNLILNNVVYALNSDMRAVDDIRSELDILEINEKFSNIIDTNLVDEPRLIANSYLLNGEVKSATSDYYVSEFIPVYGNNVTGNWYMSSSIAGFAVYNAEFEYLRSGKNVATYVYAQGDAYIRCCFKIDSGYKAFYGDVLKAYSAFTTDPNREAKEIKELKTPATIKYIGDDENCDYATVQDALSDITDDSENKPYIFYIMPGMYASFTMKYTDNTRETARIGGARWISLIGLDVTNTLFFDNRGNYEFSPCEIFTNGVIENITFIDKADVTHFDPYQDRNYAYAVHVDFGKCDVRFNNCKFYSNAGPAVGIGTYKDQLIEFYNCRFESNADGTFGSSGLGAFFCHAMTSGSAQSDRTNQRLIIHDSIAVATESLVGSRFAVISGYEGTYSYELQNFGSIGKNGAAVSLTIPDNDMFSDTCFNNVPASLNTIGV